MRWPFLLPQLFRRQRYPNPREAPPSAQRQYHRDAPLARDTWAPAGIHHGQKNRGPGHRPQFTADGGFLTSSNLTLGRRRETITFLERARILSRWTAANASTPSARLRSRFISFNQDLQVGQSSLITEFLVRRLERAAGIRGGALQAAIRQVFDKGCRCDRNAGLGMTRAHRQRL